VLGVRRAAAVAGEVERAAGADFVVIGTVVEQGADGARAGQLAAFVKAVRG